METNYDLVVIGAGSGGVRAARIAAGHGARVAIIEEYRVGGTCVIRGCVPKKLLVYASRFSDLFALAPSFGWSVEAGFDWSTLIANKDREISRLEAAYVKNLKAAGVELIRDRATMTGPNGVHLVNANRDLGARYVLLANGAHSRRPAIAGAELGITSNEAFDLKALPASILIEGGGYIGVEFATIFSGLGVATTLVYRRDRILRGFDADIRQDVEAGMTARGVKFIYARTVTALAQDGDALSVQFSDGGRAAFGAVMFATGRRPNVSGVGLETANIALTPEGAIAVDRYSRTNCPSVYAVGDVTDRAALTPVAIREGAAFADTVFGNRPTALDYSLIPSAVFGEPEAGTIGLTEAEAVTHKNIDIYLTRFRPMINSLSDRPERMLLKLITLADGGKVLGCHIVGPDAAEMVQLAAIPMAMGASKADFDRAIALHPTAGEELVTFKAPTYKYRDGVKA